MYDRDHPHKKSGQYIVLGQLSQNYDEGVSSLTGGSDRRRTPTSPEAALCQ